MFYVNKYRSTETVDFAASELKKYLRMMMPEGGDVKIAYDPTATEGFRLGLMSDFGLDTSDVEDVTLDDIIYIDCDGRGGIIAGSNPRSVLLAVYEYLKRNGCRWLYPGVDGEYIPKRDIAPVRLRHVPSMRYRGYASEGAIFRDAELDFIDFMPKLGLNCYLIQFRIPRSFYDRYYSHMRNTEHRPSEKISDTEVIQWKRCAEAEIAKRGLHFHDIGHGWTVDPFGIDAKYAWEKIDDSIVPPDMVKYLAEVRGVRGLYEGRPANTQFCMSSSEARALFVDFVTKYAAEHSNIDYLHVWLADNVNNHCECPECRKKTPSDYYVLLMNELDRALTRAGVDTKIVFIAYLDTIYPPISESIENPSRFLLMLAPISRCYYSTRPIEGREYPLIPYERNKIKSMGPLPLNIEYYKEWQKHFMGDGISFEYHFWRHMYYDLTGLQLAGRIFEDLEYYLESGVRGVIECGTLRGFFPNGIAVYTYARKMYDNSLTMEEIERDYYSHIYGENFEKFRDYFRKINEIFPYELISTNSYEGGMKKTLDVTEENIRLIDGADGVIAEGRAVIDSHYNSDVRVRTVSVRLLEYHLEYLTRFVEIMRAKFHGDDDGATELFERLQNDFGKNEIYVQDYYDHLVNFSGLSHLFKIKSNPYITD